MDSTPDTNLSIATPPSRWSRATQGDPDALRELAGSYWYCVYVWWRRAGLDAGQAASATVASFTHWITKRPPNAGDSGAGLMRMWLAARLAELAVEGWELEGEPAIAVEGEWAEEHYAQEPEGESEVIFHRRWTLTVLEFTMQALRAEYGARELGPLFVEVAPFVGFERADDAQYALAAERLGMTVGAVRKAIFDFRTHHHDLLRTMVADTVADPADLDSEITALLCACDLPEESRVSPAPLPTAIRTFKPEELLARAMNTVHMTSGGMGKWKPPSDAEIARLFPHYEMLGMAGRGGMGAVYRARQVALDRAVAIKLLPLEVSADQAFADRFVREARAMAKLSHPNIIGVFDFGTTNEGHLFFVMEYVEGANLSEMIRGPGIASDQALVIAGQVCTALAYAHGKGVIHRDIKPANVMVDTEGVVKVADFGLARMSGTDPDQFGQTVTGTVMGTPEYMSPEQKRGMAVDHRADIYSMGVMLYEMLCKEPPQGTFEPPSQRAGCDARIDQIVLKAMHRTPEGRYQSTVEMKTDIDAARTPFPASPQRRLPGTRMNPGANHPYVPPPKKSPVGLIVTLVAVALLVGGAIYFLYGNRKPAVKSAVRAVPAPAPARLSTPAPEPFGPAIPSGFKPPEVVSNAKPANESPPAPPVPLLTGPKDLLADVDVARDAKSGEWQMAPEGLLTRPISDKKGQVLRFKYVPPEDYDFEIEFTVQSGWRQVDLILAHGGVSLLWKMGYTPDDPTLFSFGDRLDGGKPDAEGRTEAVVRLPRLKLDQRYHSTVEVRRDSLRALIDGEEVLRWSGDFQRLAVDEHLLSPRPPKIGLAAWDSTIVFHKASIRPPGTATLPPPPKPKLPAVPNVAVTPAGSALVAASNDPRLVKLEAAFKARFDADAQKPYLTSLAALNQSYLVNGLARARPAAQAKGSLDEVTALDAEKDAIGKGAGVPPADVPGTPDSLKALRVQYRAVMARYTAERARVGGQLYDIYLAALDAYVVELTRANKIDEAKKVKALREEVAAKKAELAQPGVTEPSRTATAPAIPAPAAGAPLREVAKWLLAVGGRLSITKGNLQTEVLTERDIPPGKFEIISLTLDRRESRQPPLTAADFQSLKGIKTLRTVWLFSSGLGDAGFEFLADNVELTSVALHSEDFTDGLLVHLTGARKLTDLTLAYARGFTGRDLEKMRWLPGLVRADLSSCGISDEGLKVLLAAPRLRALKLYGGAVTATDAGLASLATHPALSELSFEECKGFTDAGLAVLSKLKPLTTLGAASTNFGDTAAAAFAGHSAIRQLNLKGTPLTDAGLARLAALTRLETLNVSGTKVTSAGLEAFKRTVPKCVVTY